MDKDREHDWPELVGFISPSVLVCDALYVVSELPALTAVDMIMQGIASIRQRPPTALCFSGGGSRAYTCALAQAAVRAQPWLCTPALLYLGRICCVLAIDLSTNEDSFDTLHCAARLLQYVLLHRQALEEMGLMSSVRHVAGVSGGGWAVTVMTYASPGAVQAERAARLRVPRQRRTARAHASNRQMVDHPPPPILYRGAAQTKRAPSTRWATGKRKRRGRSL